MRNLKTIALSAAVIAAMTGCGDTTVYQEPSNVTITGDSGDDNTQVTECPIPTTTKPLSGEITTDMDLTSDTLWLLSGLFVVKDGATLTIDPCTTIAGLSGTGDSTSYMIIDKGSQIIADGTEDEPIIFTSAEVALNGGQPEEGQWGGLTIIGHAGNYQTINTPYEVNGNFISDDTNLADNSGILRHVKILNSGITMQEDKEINGLSLIGVGSGTVIENITVDLSDDDGIEIWGGTVDLTNITVTRCTDDYFDIDDGYGGTVTNLTIIQESLGNAAIEMSGDTAATFDGFTIVQDFSNKEGGIFFKLDGIGGHFMNGTVTDNNMVGEVGGAIHSQGVVDIANISFENVTVNGTSTEPRFTGDSNVTLEAEFNAGTGNTVN